MTKFSWKSVLSLILTLSISTGVLLQRGCFDAGSVVQYSNRYEAAQHQTVLVSLPDGQGSGVVTIRTNPWGEKRVFVWTAAHVVAKQDGTCFSEASIILNIRNRNHKVGRTIFKGRVIGFDPNLDVALLWVDAPAEYFLGAKFDSANPPKVGASLFHVGNFLGDTFDGSVSAGILSQIGVLPDLEGWPWPISDQFTSLIIPGSSGGPVFNGDNNKVVGLAVGSVAGLIYVYVPVRALEIFANRRGVQFALRGNRCPSDAGLELLVATP